MKKRHWLGAGGTALLAAATLAGQVATPHTPVPVPRMPVPTAAILPATQTLFDGYVTGGKMPGIVGAFGVGDGPTQFVTAGHIATTPGAPDAGPDTLWRVYSMTKPVTATAAMILIEEGKIGLDDPVAKYIPAFAHMRMLTSPDSSLDSRPAARPITIRNLLTHTAGLGYNIVTKGPLLKEYERLGILPESVNVAAEVKMRAVRPKTLAEFADRVATLPLIADPGTKWSYSIGLDVMGRVIEVASGLPFDTFVDTRIFAPLKMRSSFWQVPAGEAGRLATNYTFIGQTMAPVDPAATSVFLQKPSFPYGGAGLVMSARDYDRFLHMLQNAGTLDGVRIARPETIHLMMSNLLPAGVTFTQVAPGTGGTNAPVPLGFGAGGSVYLADKPGGPSKGTYGWGGAAGTIAWVDPVKQVRGTVMVNYFPADQWPTRTDIPAALFKDYGRFRR
ncbi:serine hydrolase [Sphingomonas bacterium]|uniref:serine hydrolase domain-containing protein n=1 Tax=Sphingomonas bacterium TaxID=1895847 RepID=UPI001576184C|nr:serine hydrolase domain-containing protein [Sphingomonas bacterium]